MEDEAAPTQTQPTQELDGDELSAHEPEGWGRLVSLNVNHPSFVCIGDRVTCGRKSSCNLKIKNQSISGVHCEIFRSLSDASSSSSSSTSDEGEVVFLKDLSTNGTHLNDRKMSKDENLAISHGDEIFLLKTAKEIIGYRLELHSRLKKKGANAASSPAPHKQEVSGSAPTHATSSFVSLPCDDLTQLDLTRPFELDYVKESEIGNGAFAVVFKCLDRRTGKRYALKQIDKKKFALSSSSNRDSLKDEVKILLKLRHPNIIRIHDVRETSTELLLILELVTGGDLFDRIMTEKRFSEDRARQIFIQCLNAVEYLHHLQIVHRDLKPENILLARKDSDEIKISDFGLSRVLGEGSFLKTICGTPQYLAPEVLKHELGEHVDSYSNKVDIWSLGVILYILLSGITPFRDQQLVSDVTKAIIRFPPSHFNTVSQQAKELIIQLLKKNPAERYGVYEIFEDPWIKPHAKPSFLEEEKQRKAQEDMMILSRKDSTAPGKRSYSAAMSLEPNNNAGQDEDAKEQGQEGEEEDNPGHAEGESQPQMMSLEMDPNGASASAAAGQGPAPATKTARGHPSRVQMPPPPPRAAKKARK